MFNCMTCGKMYVCQDDLLKHAKNHDTSSFLCDICFNIFTHQDDLFRHIRNVHKSTNHTHRCHDATRTGGALIPIARSTVIHLTPSASTPDARQQAIQPLTVAQREHTTTLSRPPAHNNTPGTATPSTTTVYGGSPSLMPHSYSMNSVENIKTQKDRIQSVSRPVGFIEIGSSFKRTTVWYFRKNVYNVTSYRAFLQSIESELIEKLRECVSVHPIKYNLKLEAAYIITAEIDNISENPEFSTPARQLFVHSNVKGLVECDFTILLAKEEHYEGKDRFSLSCIGGLILCVHQYNPPTDRWSYLPLPKSIVNRRAVVNPQTFDQQSFKWAILAKHVSKNRGRVGRNYLNEDHRYDFSVLSVPTTVSEIKLFERANPGTSVNVYGLKNNGENKNEKSLTKLVVYPLRVTDEEMPNHFDLLLITSSENKNHYTYISNFSRLVSSQINNRYYRRLIFCKKCLQHFSLQPFKSKAYGEEALEHHRLFNKCVFNPNTALQASQPRLRSSRSSRS